MLLLNDIKFGINRKASYSQKHNSIVCLRIQFAADNNHSFCLNEIKQILQPKCSNWWEFCDLNTFAHQIIRYRLFVLIVFTDRSDHPFGRCCCQTKFVAAKPCCILHRYSSRRCSSCVLYSIDLLGASCVIERSIAFSAYTNCSNRSYSSIDLLVICISSCIPFIARCSTFFLIMVNLTCVLIYTHLSIGNNNNSKLTYYAQTPI